MYNNSTLNPILEVLADQLKHDPEWAGKEYVSSDLLSDILMALEENTLALPEDFNLVTNKEWIDKMRIDPSFYKYIHWCFRTGDASKLQLYEKALLKLAANFLGKTFNLVPILDEDPYLTIAPSLSISSTRQYHIAYCNKLYKDNCFISVFPKREELTSRGLIFSFHLLLPIIAAFLNGFLY